MKLVSVIYFECNNELFENIPEIDFYSVLNAQHTTHKLKIKAKEKIRTCYLIYKLCELLPTDEKENWLNYILSTIDISENLYLSKYKEASSQYAGRKSFDFVKKIDKIFEA
jgi:hypothetical protein